MNTPRLPILTLPQAIHSVPRSVHGARIKSPSRPLLIRGPFSERPDIWSLNLVAEGSLWPALDETGSKLTERISAELDGLRGRPRCVMIDVPNDRAAVRQSELAAVVRLLGRFDIGVRLHTATVFEPELVSALEDWRELVTVSVSLTCLDRNLYRTIEPQADLPEDRLESIADLIDRGISVDSALDPLIPTVTDLSGRVRAVLESLADAGVETVTLGYLVLRSGTRERLHPALDSLGCADSVFACYADGPMLREGEKVAQFLSKPRRQRGYAAMMAVAAELGIAARLAARANPISARRDARSQPVNPTRFSRLFAVPPCPFDPRGRLRPDPLSIPAGCLYNNGTPWTGDLDDRRDRWFG